MILSRSGWFRAKSSELYRNSLDTDDASCQLSNHGHAPIYDPRGILDFLVQGFTQKELANKTIDRNILRMFVESFFPFFYTLQREVNNPSLEAKLDGAL